MGIIIFYYIAIYVLEKEKPTSLVLLHGVGGFTVLGWLIVCLVKEITMSMSLWILTMCIIWALSVLTVIDCKRNRIPNSFLRILLLIWGIVMAFDIMLHGRDGLGLLVMSLIGAFIGGIVFFLCYIISKKQLGAGDVKLVFILGLFLTGQRVIDVIFYSTLLCLVFCFIQLYRKKIGKKSTIPMVPFLYLGTWITFLTV